MLQFNRSNTYFKGIITMSYTINGFTSKASAIRHLRANGHKICTILAKPESNPKVAKNGRVVDVMTAPLHLAPFNLSGFQVCPKASTGCAAACLHTAGNPAYMEQKEASRIAKTRAYFLERKAFMAVLVFEMLAHRRKWSAQGYDVAYRLNATSDLPFELRKVDINGTTITVMEFFRDCQFYDYTAVTKRAIAWAKGNMPSNYHLTFSRKEDNDADCLEVMAAGGNVAACAELGLYKSSMQSGVITMAGQTWGAVDGDQHDYRPADPKNTVIVLKAKGDAKRDTSGFTLRA